MAYKHDYDKILTRLTVILSRLNDGEALSVKALATEFNTSDRTIQRDFNERLVTFPIYQENKKWKMQEGFRVEKIKDLEDELILDIMEKITESIGGKFASKSKQLLSKIKNEDFNPIYTKLNIEDISDKFSEIQLLETAIRTKKEIRCTYNNEKYPPYQTHIQPLKITNYEGFWYLIALKKDVLQKFYLKNISGVHLTDTSFTTDSKLEALLQNSISIWFSKDTTPFKVKLYATKTAAKYFKRRPLPTQSITSLNQDGTMEFSVNITHEMEILPIIKYWVPHLYVLEPEWLREIIEKDISEFSQNCETF